MDDVITSKENEKVKYIKSLYKKKTRNEERKYIVEGIRFVEEALGFPELIEMIVYAPKLLVGTRGQSLLKTVADLAKNVLTVSDAVFKEMSDTANPQGILAVVKMPTDFAPVDDMWTGQPLLLLVDGVQDPGNLGSIVRSADAAGVNGLILLKGTVDLYNPKTLRSTMGSIFRVPVWQVEQTAELKQLLRSKGIKVFAATAAADTLIYEAQFKQPAAILMGSEAVGPRNFSVSDADVEVSIPMPGSTESLNVAVATGIILFEALRQRSGK